VEEGKRCALIVAISKYQDPKFPPLHAPKTDAEQLGRVFEDPSIGSFTAEVLRDENEQTVRRKLSSFFGRGVLPNDLLLVHFSCHGITDAAGTFYFAATDTQKDELAATAISGTWVLDQMNSRSSRRIVLLLDCCYSGAFPMGMVPRGDAVAVVQQLSGKGRVAITASTAREFAWEGDQRTGEPRPSVFTDAVVRGLETGEADRDGDGLISVDELYDFVYRTVKETTPYQTPGRKARSKAPSSSPGAG
jgi:uncharacterized caspase-like protein